MNNKIKSLVEELKSEIKRETGMKTDIGIRIHQQRNKSLDFSKANKTANILHSQLGGNKKIGSSDDLIWVSNEDGIAEFSVYTSKRKSVVK